VKLIVAKLSDDDAEFLRTLLVQRRQMIRRNQARTLDGVLRQRAEFDSICRIEQALTITDVGNDPA
jgi:hypothetical protein